MPKEEAVPGRVLSSCIALTITLEVLSWTLQLDVSKLWNC